MSKRRVFSEEFKRDAVALVLKSGNLVSVARDLGVHENTLSRWKQRLSISPERPFPGHGNPHDVETARLKRENARLSEEVEILKKAVGIFVTRPK